MLTQRFPLIQRIDIVLVPQHGGFDEKDSGYVNGDAMTSPTHEDWLKTTDEERAARMRAQVSICASSTSDLSPNFSLTSQKYLILVFKNCTYRPHGKVKLNFHKCLCLGGGLHPVGSLDRDPR